LKQFSKILETSTGKEYKEYIKKGKKVADEDGEDSKQDTIEEKPDEIEMPPDDV
jgi:hypothetical protein